LPLFRFVDKAVWGMPTFGKFYALLDNYESATGLEEDITQEEKKENWDFLEAVMGTGPMKWCFRYLQAAGKLPGGIRSEQDFKQLLYKMWFYSYKRETRNDSSGFEHVFVGEHRDGQVIGMHNWVQLLVEEIKKNVDYRGCIARRGSDVEEMAKQQVLSLQFEWKGELKPVGTSFVGVSPEFEVALYTMCALAGSGKDEMELGGAEVGIVVHTFGQGDRMRIGSSYPTC